MLDSDISKRKEDKYQKQLSNSNRSFHNDKYPFLCEFSELLSKVSTKIFEEVLQTSQQKKLAKIFWDAENYGGSEAKCIKQLTERYGPKWHEITSIVKETTDIREYYQLVLILDHKKQWDVYRKSANIA